MNQRGSPLTNTAPATFIPALRWLANYGRSPLRRDVIAGITLAAYLLPAGIGDASLAGLPPEAGLYACLYAGLCYWVFCSSRHTAISVTSAISLLLGSTLGGLAGDDPTRYAALAAGVAVFVAAIASLAWLVKAGAVVSFISESVMVGFKCGVALFLASSQLPKLFGFHGAHGDFWENSTHFLRHLHETHLSSLVVGGSALAVLLLGKVFLKHRPVALFVVIAAILASWLFDLEARGVKLLGTVPQGLPSLGIPSVHWSDFNELLPLAFACFLLGAVETAAIGRTFAAKHGGRFDANQEFLALAAANLAAGLGRGFPVSGGMSQSMVNESAGASTPASGAIAAGVLLLVVLFFSPWLRALPQPVLAAVVLVAVAGLFQYPALKHLWSSDRAEFFVAGAAFLGVLGSGLLRGVLIGAIISLVQLLRRAARPHVAVLGRIPGTRQFSDCRRNPANEQVPGMLIVRPEASLHYFNVDYVCEQILQLSRTVTPAPKSVLLDFSASPSIDLQSTLALAAMVNELQVEGILVRAAEVRGTVRDRFRREGLAERISGVTRGNAVADVVEDYQSRASTIPSPGNAQSD